MCRKYPSLTRVASGTCPPWSRRTPAASCQAVPPRTQMPAGRRGRLVGRGSQQINQLHARLCPLVLICLRGGGGESAKTATSGLSAHQTAPPKPIHSLHPSPTLPPHYSHTLLRTLPHTPTVFRMRPHTSHLDDHLELVKVLDQLCRG